MLGSDHHYATWISAKARPSVCTDWRLAESFSGTVIRLQHQTTTEKLEDTTQKLELPPCACVASPACQLAVSTMSVQTYFTER